MPPPLRVAVVGAGFFASFHLEAWSRLTECGEAVLAGLCERDPERRAAAAERFPSVPVFAEAEAMAAEVTPDLLDLVVPPSEHLALIRRLLPFGAAIQCQKPFCDGLAGARQAVAQAEAAGVVLAVHENFRFQPWYREIEWRLASGELGQVYQASFRLRPGDGQGPRAYLDRQPYFQTMERFLVHETAIHLIDTFRFLFGEPGGLFARLARLNPAIRGEDAGTILLDFGKGLRALFDGNRLVDHAAENRRRVMGEMLIEGSAGTLRLDGDGRLWRRAFGSNEQAELAYDWDDRGFAGDCVFACNRHLARHLREGGPLETGARAYLANLAIEEAVYRSAAAGRWIEGPFGADDRGD